MGYGEYQRALTTGWDKDDYSYGSFTSGEEDQETDDSDGEYGPWHGDDGSQDFQ